MQSGGITSWAELASHLGARWEPGQVERAVLTIEGQSLEVRVVDVFGAPWVELLGSLGSARYMSPFFILERNFQVPVGAIGLRDGELVIRQRVPLEGLGTGDLDAALTSLARQCAQGLHYLQGARPRSVTP